MTNQDLIKKLNNLKDVNPDDSWLKSNRELLLSQISNSGAENIPAWRTIFITFSSIAKTASRPAFALGAFVLMLLTGSFFSNHLLEETKPNDSLYIARIISEKVKLNTIFDGEARNKLAVQYATEHAQDITAVLANPEFNTEANQEEIAVLNDSFHKEVNAVKSRIETLAVKNSPLPAAVAPTGAIKNNNDSVVIADNNKEGQGIQVATSDILAPAKTIETSTPAASSSPIASSTLKVDTVKPAAEKILDEAKQLFDQKDYSKASDKLKEIDNIIK